MNYIDLRSDSVTQPTLEMREAMYTATVGDDVLGDDPTVKRLEKLCAKMMGKESGLFVASGTMGNQLAVMTHTVRGDEMLISADSHIIVHEVGAAAVLSGVTVKAVQCTDGVMTAQMIENNCKASYMYSQDKKSLICLENALTNGKVMRIDQMQECYLAAKKFGYPVHLDGARIFNAAVSLGASAKEIADCSDSVMVCLSKGLSAPVGSVLCGSEDFIQKARKNRQLLGGGMRQAGLIAACGIIALEKMVDRLQDDHDNAKYLAQRLFKMKDVMVLKDNVDINIVFFKIKRSPEFVRNLPSLMLEYGIKITGEEAGMLRFVTNNDVSRQNVIYVADTLEKILNEQ